MSHSGHKLGRLVTCWKCDGCGKVDCDACAGMGAGGLTASSEENTHGTCEICHGRGKVTCYKCKGHGMIPEGD